MVTYTQLVTTPLHSAFVTAAGETEDYTRFRAENEMVRDTMAHQGLPDAFQHSDLGRSEKGGDGTSNIVPRNTPNPLPMKGEGAVDDWYQYQFHPATGGNGQYHYRWYIRRDQSSLQMDLSRGLRQDQFLEAMLDVAPLADNDVMNGQQPSMSVPVYSLAARLHHEDGIASQAKWRALPEDRNNLFTVVCEQLDAQRRVTARAAYAQTVQDAEKAAVTQAMDDYLDAADRAADRIPAALKVAIPAAYRRGSNGETRSLKLFIGHTQAARGAAAATGILALADSSVVLVDLTPDAERIEYEGQTVEEALHAFKAGNSYEPGAIELEIPTDTLTVHGKQIAAQPAHRQLTTKGHSEAVEQADFLGGVGLAMTVASAAIPETWPVRVPYLVLVALTASFGSGELNLEDELHKTKMSGRALLIDLLTMAAAIAGARAPFSKLLGPAMERFAVAGLERFLFWSEFASNAGVAVLVNIDTVIEIDRIKKEQEEHQLSESEAIAKIVHLLLNAVVGDGLLLVGAKTAGGEQHEMRLRELGQDHVVGTWLARYPQEEQFTLDLLDDLTIEELAKLGATPKQTHALASLGVSGNRPAQIGTLLRRYGRKVLVTIDQPQTPVMRVPWSLTALEQQLAALYGPLNAGGGR